MFAANFSTTMKCLVFALIVILAVNDITAAPSPENSDIVFPCTPLFGLVSTMENKDNYINA